MAKLRIGFVGVGTMGQAAHLRNYATLPDCEVVAIAEIRPKLGQAVADRYGIPHVYRSAQEMLASETLDGLVAIQQFSTHASILPELLQAQLPTMIEKPLADSVESGKMLADLAAKTNPRLVLAYHKRSDPASVYALDQIRKWKKTGEAGKLKYMRITMPPGDWIREGFSSNITTDEKYDVLGGAWSEYVTFVNYYIHQVNLFRYFLEEDFKVAYADPSGVIIAIQSDSGIPGTLEMAPYQTAADWQESAFIAFEKAWIRLDLPAPLVLNQSGTVTVYQNDSHSQPALKPWHAMRCQANYFLQAIRGKPTPLCGPNEALKDLTFAQQYIDTL